jgi:hypothetical protein
MTGDTPIDPNNGTATPSHEDIARLAYALWETRGDAPGQAEQDWLDAERQLVSADATISRKE